MLLAFAVLSRGADLYQVFRDPPHSYSLSPYWYWNGKITPEETRRQIQEMIRQGVYQAIVFPWDGMEVRYLSEDYWRQIGAALDIAKEFHFTLNIADEYDWPSGHAWDFGSEKPELSKVLQEHPEFRMQHLRCTEEIVEGPARWNPEPADSTVLARLDGSGALDEKSMRILTGAENLPAGKWLVSAYRLEPVVGAHNTRVDLLNPDAVKVYLALVYEEYARRFPQHLGTTLKLTVADHEGAYGVQIAYTPRLWNEFERRHHYDLRRVLPLLGHDTADGVFSKKVRQDYLDTISELYVNSFTKQVADWCTRHGLLHGTSLYEEQLYIQVNEAGDMFRHWRAGSFVMIDALLERSRMPIDFKEAVSVAHFDRKPLVVENQGLQGHSTFFSLEKARLGSNMCLLWGANRLVPYFDYDPRKTTWPPQWFLGQPFRRYFHRYADYVRRAQFMNGQGRHIAPILIYYPLETAFANSKILFTNRRHRDLYWNSPVDDTENFYTALQLELAEQGWDYHIVDSHYLEQATIRNGALKLADESFRVLILPPMTDIAGTSLKQIRMFASSHGTVFAVGDQPGALAGVSGIHRFETGKHKPFMDRLDYMHRVRVPEGVRNDLRPLLEALRSIEPPQVEVIGKDKDGLYWSHRRDADTDWYWIVNDTPHERRATFRFLGSGMFEKWDVETGERFSLETENIGEKSAVTLDLAPWDGFFVVKRAGHADKASPRRLKDVPRDVVLAVPDAGWTLTPETDEIAIPYAKREADGKWLWLAPERLSNRKWWLAGPFPYNDHRGFFTAYPPESGFNPAEWKWTESPGYTVTLPRGRTPGIYYAFAYVYSPEARQGRFVTAFADSLKVWWNGEVKLMEHRHPKWLLLRDPWAEKRKIEIRKGWNTVLLKIGPSLMVPTAFSFRIVDDNGATMRDLAYLPDKTLPPAEPPKAVRLIVPAPPGAEDRLLTVEQGREPEHPITFPARTFPFRLQSWTDCGLAHYSGTAMYEIQFTLPAALQQRQLFLDLGEVGVAAEVWVNDKKVGERVWRPFRFDISDAVRPGENRLRVRVANSDAGWQSQGGTIYPRGSWGLKYETERDRLPTIRPNGLEGPVRILAISAK